MKLTGKAKEAFKAYYVDQYQEGTFRQYDWFKDLPEAFKWGVYQDWADRLGYELQTYVSMSNPIFFAYVINRIEDDRAVGHKAAFKTRQESRNAAVDKLDDLINRQRK